MKRREFITLLGGAAAWPFAARAQPGEKLRHIGVLMPVAEADLVGQARLGAFLQGLQQLGWAAGRNVRIDARWGASDLDLIRKYARELVTLGPDAIMANGTEATAALRQVTRTIPIVFAPVVDPVGAGYVESLARPGGNVTGFSGYEFALGGKWLELLKEIAPRVARVAVTRDSAGAGPTQFAAIQAVAPSVGVEIAPVRCAQCRRDRACHRGVCGEFKRWPDRNRNCRGNGSSRTDRWAGGTAPITRHLL